jgi:hypothetical protein
MSIFLLKTCGIGTFEKNIRVRHKGDGWYPEHLKTIEFIGKLPTLKERWPLSRLRVMRKWG